jgi:hypothetical protein
VKKEERKMDLFHIVSEERIKKALEEGEFDNLPGMGKSLSKDDMAGVPQELRMAYKLMKNAGFTEEENVLRQEMMTIETLLRKCADDEEKAELQGKLNEKLLRFNQMMSKRGGQTNSAIFKNYQQKMQSKFK